jgi:hypothetical protein
MAWALPMSVNSERHQWSARAAFAGYLEGEINDREAVIAARRQDPKAVLDYANGAAADAMAKSVLSMRLAATIGDQLTDAAMLANAAPGDRARDAAAAQHEGLVRRQTVVLAEAVDQRVRVERAKSAAAWAALAIAAQRSGDNDAADYFQKLALAVLSTPIATGSAQKAAEVTDELRQQGPNSDSQSGKPQYSGDGKESLVKRSEYYASASGGMPFNSEPLRPPADVVSGRGLFETEFLDRAWQGEDGSGRLLPTRSGVSKAEAVARDVMDNNPSISSAADAGVRLQQAVSRMVFDTSQYYSEDGSGGPSGLVGEDYDDERPESFGTLADDLDPVAAADIAPPPAPDATPGQDAGATSSWISDQANNALNEAKTLVPGNTIIGKVLRGDIGGAAVDGIKGIVQSAAAGNVPRPPPSATHSPTVMSWMRQIPAILGSSGGLPIMALGGVVLAIIFFSRK